MAATSAGKKDRSQQWTYTDLDGTVTMTEAEILAAYGPYWREQMRRVGKEAEITEQGCIDDWVVVNWAERLR
jgi:hypothetical protein